jgi:hypothetical protein
MNENKYVFISDLINKYTNPIVPANPIFISTPTQASCKITRNFKDGARTRFNSSIYSDETEEAYEADEADTTTANIKKDAGTLFKEAYNLRRQNRAANNSSMKNKDIELEEIKIKQNPNDLL